MKEIWKDIKDYEGLYQISNLGRVKSLPRDTNNQFGKENNVKPGSVSNACRGKNKTLKGYIWKYVNKGGKDE